MTPPPPPPPPPPAADDLPGSGRRDPLPLEQAPAPRGDPPPGPVGDDSDDANDDANDGGGGLRFGADGSPILPMEQAPAASVTTRPHRAIDRLPLDDDDDDDSDTDTDAAGGEDLFGRRRAAAGKRKGSKKSKVSFKEEDENRELKGCAAFVIVALVIAGLWWVLKDVVDFSGGPDEPASQTRTKPPPITKVEAIPEKRVVQEPVEGRTVLARKLTAPGEEDEADQAGAKVQKRTVTTAAIMNIADELGSPTVGGVLEQVTARSVCYNGQPARRMPSLYGLEGGFGVTFAAPDSPTGLPRLEFLPPSLAKGPPVLYYVSFSEGRVKGFDGNQARTVPDQPRAISRVILAWVAEIANTDCGGLVDADRGTAVR